MARSGRRPSLDILTSTCLSQSSMPFHVDPAPPTRSCASRCGGPRGTEQTVPGPVDVNVPLTEKQELTCWACSFCSRWSDAGG